MQDILLLQTGTNLMNSKNITYESKEVHMFPNDPHRRCVCQESSFFGSFIVCSFLRQQYSSFFRSIRVFFIFLIYFQSVESLNRPQNTRVIIFVPRSNSVTLLRAILQLGLLLFLKYQLPSSISLPM